MKKLFFIVLCLVYLTTMAQNNGKIFGYVTDASTQKPLQGVLVQIKSINKTAVTNALGKYELNNIANNSYTLTASITGFATQEKYNILVTSGNTNELNFELEIQNKELGDVVVNSTRKTAKVASLQTPLSVQRLTVEEIKANPGGNFDISRVVNALPGISGSSGSVGGYRNDIIVRGGGPSENVFYIDGIEIPNINHFATLGSGGGPTGILNVSFIEDVKVSTGAFDAKYNNALSSVFEFKQKNGNINKLQGNVRLSGTELAATFDGPLSKKNNITYLASVRRSYLQLLFSAIDLPIRPNFWDYQYKMTYKPNTKSTLTILGVGAIDGFSFGSIKKPTQDKIYTLNQVPSITQRSYTVGANYKHTLNNGFYNVYLSRSTLTNELQKYDNNETTNPLALRLSSLAKQAENKLKLEVNQSINNIKFSYGVLGQYAGYNTTNNIRRRAAVGSQPEDRIFFTNNISLLQYGLFAQAGSQFFNNSFSLNFGIRADGNNFTTNGNNLASTLSPRLSASYALSKNITLNATIGQYAKMPMYTMLAFKNNQGDAVNKNAEYIKNTQVAAGIEYLPKSTTRFTIEGFYKKYSHVPVTVKDGININNIGADFGSVGNEAITSTGKGESYGVEIFAQQKLTKQFFGTVSYTFFYSKFSNADGAMKPSSWDNRHLLATTLGYKLKRNWEIGIKYRFQGGAPYTPFNIDASRNNYLTLGQGILDYNQFNTLRLSNFSSSDLRIDKKWNFKKATFDLYLDITNWWAAKSVGYPKYSFERNLTTQNYITSDGKTINTDGSNAIPYLIENKQGNAIPTIGFIVEF